MTAAFQPVGSAAFDAEQFRKDRLELKRLILASRARYGGGVTIPAALYDRLCAAMEHFRANEPEKIPATMRDPAAPMHVSGVTLVRGAD